MKKTEIRNAKDNDLIVEYVISLKKGQGKWKR